VSCKIKLRRECLDLEKLIEYKNSPMESETGLFTKPYISETISLETRFFFGRSETSVLKLI